MTAPLLLYYAPDNASLCVRLALEEMGLDYRTVLVDRGQRDQDKPEYRRLNPNGLIPTLGTPDGPIYETAAILLWLADRTGQMFPAPGDADRGDALKWLFWLSNTLHPSERMLFYPDKYAPDGQAEALAAKAAERIHGHFALLETEAPNWLSAAPSILSCYLAPMLRWPALYGGQAVRIEAYPRLLAFAREFEARPSMQAASRAEGLGPTPISNPSLPDPPEGSVL